MSAYHVGTQQWCRFVVYVAVSNFVYSFCLAYLLTSPTGALWHVFITVDFQPRNFQVIFEPYKLWRLILSRCLNFIILLCVILKLFSFSFVPFPLHQIFPTPQSLSKSRLAVLRVVWKRPERRWIGQSVHVSVFFINCHQRHWLDLLFHNLFFYYYCRYHYYRSSILFFFYFFLLRQLVLLFSSSLVLCLISNKLIIVVINVVERRPYGGATPTVSQSSCWQLRPHPAPVRCDPWPGAGPLGITGRLAASCVDMRKGNRKQSVTWQHFAAIRFARSVSSFSCARRRRSTHASTRTDIRPIQLSQTRRSRLILASIKVKNGWRWCIAFYGSPSYRYGASPAIWDHTVLPTTR